MRQKEEVWVCGKCQVEQADPNLKEEKKRGRSVSFAV
jgi:ribosomal protein L37AE/L43A